MVTILDASEYVNEVKGTKTSADCILQMNGVQEKDPFLVYQQAHGINTLEVEKPFTVRWARKNDGDIIVENRGKHDTSSWPFNVLSSYKE